MEGRIEMTEENLQLLGKIIIKGKICCLTGLRIGGPRVGLEIGGLDNPVIRDPVTGEPYIPGSSLKGKMRSLLEKSLGLKLTPLPGTENIRIHSCSNKENAKKCPVCRIFGISAENAAMPTVIIVRDATLTKESKEKLEKAETDLPYTEIKWENILDRITSAATPRQMERVPAGAEFNFEIVYNIYNDVDKDYLRYVFEAMKLLEDDYLGGSGTRGYGKIVFKDIKVIERTSKYYKGEENEKVLGKDVYSDVKSLINDFDRIRGML